MKKVDDKQEFLQQVAKTNPVDLDRVLVLEQQIKELERIGMFQRPPYSVKPPLATPSHSQRSQTLATIGRPRR